MKVSYIWSVKIDITVSEKKYKSELVCQDGAIAETNMKLHN